MTLGVLALRAQTTLSDFTYTFSVAPSSSYPDSSSKLNDGVAGIPAWGAGGYSNTYNQFYVGWANDSAASVPVTMTFNFSVPVTLQSVSFYFADSNGQAGVYYPLLLNLTPAAGATTLTSGVNPDPAGYGTAMPYTFNVGGVTTNQVVLDAYMAPQAWMMMTEASFTGSAIPEPSTYAAIAGAAGLAFAIWQRRRRKTAC
jgi:hypothetical protein